MDGDFADVPRFIEKEKHGAMLMVDEAYSWHYGLLWARYGGAFWLCARDVDIWMGTR